MQYVPMIVVLLFCSPAVFLPARMQRMIITLAVIALALGGISLLWAMRMPKNFLASHPWAADSPLHPEIAGPAGGILLLFGIGLGLALGVRYALITAKWIKPR